MSLPVLLRHLALTLFVLNLAACGGGGGGGDSGGGGSAGGSTPPSVPANAPNRYLPTDPSLRWHFALGGAPLSEPLYFQSSIVRRQQRVHPLVFPTGGKEYFVTSADQLKLAGLYLPLILVDGDAYSGDITFDTAEVVLSNSWIAGQSSMLSGSGSVNIAPTYGARPMSYTGSVQYLGESNASTVLGVLPVKVFSVDLTMTASVEGVSFMIPYRVTYALALDVGIVSREQGGIIYQLTALAGSDRDSDGVADAVDRFPDDGSESADSDLDGVGNNTDSDDDNDGVADVVDAFPRDSGETIDSDNDGIGNNADVDDDNDTVADSSDPYPTDSQRWERLGVGSAVLEFESVYGSSEQPASKLLQLTGANTRWQVTSSESWVEVSDSSGQAPGSIAVSVRNQALVLGDQTAILTFTDQDTGEQVTKTVSAQARAPQLSVSPLGIELDGSFGWNHSNVDPFSFDVSLNTGTNKYPLNLSVATTHTGALTLSSSDTELGGNTETVTVTVHPEVLMEGEFPDEITISADFGAGVAEVTVPVTIKASEHVLYASDDGIALTATPSFSRLSRSVTIRDSYGVTTTVWNATSSQSWLSVTANGVTGGQLVLTADPSGLATNAVHRAVVSIDSTDPKIERGETIEVALWVGSVDPAAQIALPVSYLQIAADPVQPYIYVHAGGGNVDIYNTHTQTLVGTIAGVGSVLGEMKVSSDGLWLFVKDDGNQRVLRIELNNTANRDSFGFTGNAFAYMRLAGYPFLILDTGRYLDLREGRELAMGFPPVFYGTAAIDASRDGNRFCQINAGVSPSTLECLDISYSTLLDAMRTDTSRSLWGVGSNSKDVALNLASDRVYTASGHPYQFVEFGIASSMSHEQSLAADGYPNAVEISDDGTIFGAADAPYGPNDLWIFNSDGSLRKSVYVSGYAQNVFDRRLVVSGDGLMAVLLTTDPAMVFVRAD